MVQVITDQNRMNDAAMHKLGAFINPFSGCGQAALCSSLGLKIVPPPLDQKLCHATENFHSFIIFLAPLVKYENKLL